MKCRDCGWEVKKCFSLSWSEFGMCPRCLGTKTHKDKKFDAPIISVQVNPVDMYWHKLTDRQMLLDSQKSDGDYRK